MEATPPQPATHTDNSGEVKMFGRSWQRGSLLSLLLLTTLPLFASPNIAGLSPQSGIIGAYVSISGSGFGTTQDISSVMLNGASVSVASWSDTNIIAVVPPGATSGPFVVTVNGQSANSQTFTVTLIPTNWLDGDVGTVGLSGGATYSGGVFTVKGAGQSIGGTADAMHFVYQALSGDGSIVARVASLQGASYPLAGVMIRETLSPGATSAFVYYSPNQGYLLTRTSTGGSTSSQSTFVIASATRYWVKLTRVSNSFTGYVSSDGMNWTQTVWSLLVVLRPPRRDLTTRVEQILKPA
jgi:hypothetical protein